MWIALCVAAYAAVLALNWPGHMSLDSVLTLREGRLGVHNTWNPVVAGWLMGIFDRVYRGPGLYVAFVSAIFFASVALLPVIAGRVSRGACLLLPIAVLLPQVSIYQGIAWKDVAFANFSVFGFVVIALSPNASPRSRAVLLALAALAFAFASTLRQNGAIVALVAAVAISISRSGSLGRRALMSAGWLVCVGSIAMLMTWVANPVRTSQSADIGRGVGLLRRYDLSGAISNSPNLPLPAIEAYNSAYADEFRSIAIERYSPERIDTINTDKYSKALWREIPDDTVERDWLYLLSTRAGDYFWHRLSVFHWILTPPEPSRCLPVWVGVDGPAYALRDLGLVSRMNHRDRIIYEFSKNYWRGPLMNHLFYGVLSIFVTIVLWSKRSAEDSVMISMAASGILFSASFFFIGIACDYRYLYLLDMSSILLTMYAFVRRFPFKADSVGIGGAY